MWKGKALGRMQILKGRKMKVNEMRHKKNNWGKKMNQAIPRNEGPNKLRGSSTLELDGGNEGILKREMAS
jgi:hypothetical protein